MPWPIPQILNALARATLGVWHAMFESGNMDDLDRLFVDEVIFRSPVAYTSYPGRTTTTLMPRTVNAVFEDLKYYRSFVIGDGASVVLELSANVNGKVLRGIDMVRFDAEGKIVEFEVMVRPAVGLQALGAAMGVKLGDKIALLKAGARPVPPSLRSFIP